MKYVICRHCLGAGKIMATPRHSSASLRPKRIEWLKKHKTLWFGWLGRSSELLRQKEIVRAMQTAGLYSPTTYYIDVGLTGLIDEIRKDEKLLG